MFQFVLAVNLVILAFDFDPIWFGVILTINMELGLITPPVGLNLFVLQGLTRHDLTFVARAAIPMFFLMLLAALLSYYFQDLILWLPNRM